MRAHLDPMPAPMRGSVLIVSLLMLLVLTLIGVTALSVVTIEERMARGFEHGEVTFQGSESALNLTVKASSPDVAGYDKLDDQLATAINSAVCAGGTITSNTSTATYDVDPNDRIPAVLTSTVVVTYLGEQPAPGFSFGVNTGLKAHTYQATATTTFGSTEISAVHDQGLYVVMQGSGDCDYTGIPP